MIQTTSSTLLDRSRLVGLLMELSKSKLNSAEYNLAERLSYLIGVQGSINLARTLQHLPTHINTTVSDNSVSLQDDVLTTCRSMVNAITSGFADKLSPDNETDTQLIVPTAWHSLKIEILQTYEPYRRFYSAHQTEMGVGLQTLRQRVRAHLTNTSIELHQLTELDIALDDNLAPHTRRLFNVIPKLLEQRFKLLLAQHNESSDSNKDELEHWLAPGGWLELFYQDLRELLLAEFDLRLQPILGLLEAVNEQKNTSS